MGGQKINCLPIRTQKIGGVRLQDELNAENKFETFSDNLELNLGSLPQKNLFLVVAILRVIY